MSQEDVLRVINENCGELHKKPPERLGIWWNVGALVRALKKKGLFRRAGQSGSDVAFVSYINLCFEAHITDMR